MTPCRFNNTAEVELSCQPVTPARDHERDHSRSHSPNYFLVHEDGEQDEVKSFFAKYNKKADALKTLTLEFAAMVISQAHNCALHN